MIPSTTKRCSERFLAEASSPDARRSSASGLSPRGAVPARAVVCSRGPSRVTNSSGVDPRKVVSPTVNAKVAQAGLRRRSRSSTVTTSSSPSRAKVRARTTLWSLPRSIASTAEATRARYSSSRSQAPSPLATPAVTASADGTAGGPGPKASNRRSSSAAAPASSPSGPTRVAASNQVPPGRSITVNSGSTSQQSPKPSQHGPRCRSCSASPSDPLESPERSPVGVNENPPTSTGAGASGVASRRIRAASTARAADAAEKRSLPTGLMASTTPMAARPMPASGRSQTLRCWSAPAAA